MAAPHVCFNCKLEIKEDEPEVLISEEEMARIKSRLSKGGLTRGVNDTPIRYRHETYEICSAAEAREARW